MNRRLNNLIFRIAFVLGIAAMIWGVTLKDIPFIVVTALGTVSALSIAMFFDKIEQPGYLLPTVTAIFTLAQIGEVIIYGYTMSLRTIGALDLVILVPIFFAYHGASFFVNMLKYPN